ncbi:hypothetical protein J5751_03245 [bacterium]|nr:hypothetical protein [bacterium]
MEKNENENPDERMIELKLFNQIMKWEHENKHSKEYTDRQMQERIKKLIQNQIQLDK